MALSAEMQALIKGQKQKMARNAGKATDYKEGRNRVRLMPSWRPADGSLGDPAVFFHAFGLHWVKDEMNKVQAVVGCYNHTFETPCQFCDSLDRAAKSKAGDPVIEKVIKEAKSKKKVLTNIVDRSSGTDEVVLRSHPWSVFRDMINIMDTYSDEYGDMMDLKTGIDFIVERTGKGTDTEYSVLPAPGVSKPVDPKLMEKAINIDDFIKGEFEAKAAKAINAIAHVTGTPAMIGTAGAAMLSGPRPVARSTVIENETVGTVIDDAIPASGGGTKTAGAAAAAPSTPAPATVVETVAPEAAPAQPAPATASPPPADNFGKELGDADIDAMLSELNLG